MELKTAKFDENQVSNLDTEKLEAAAIKTAISNANKEIHLSEEEKDDLEFNEEAMEEARLDQYIQTLPQIHVPEGAYLEEDYLPWAVQYEEEIDGKYYQVVKWLA